MPTQKHEEPSTGGVPNVRYPGIFIRPPVRHLPAHGVGGYQGPKRADMGQQELRAYFRAQKEQR